MPSSFCLRALRRSSTPISAPYLRQAFSTSPPRPASVLFALHALSNSRETQHFNRVSHLPRFEHSPPLKLIKTSEVDPFPLPTPSPKPIASSWLKSPGAAHGSRALDEKSVRVGRAILSDYARHVSRLQNALDSAKEREARREALMAKERAAWQQETQKLRGDVRTAGGWIVLSIGTATALASWRFWPQPATSSSLESGELSRQLAERMQKAVALPPSVPASAVEAPIITDKAVQTAPIPKADSPPMAAPPVSPRSGWLSGLFWKQQR
jgi:hypothetical protein